MTCAARPSGRGLVGLSLLCAAVALTVFVVYGWRAMERRGEPIPIDAARIFLRADNTAVGFLGGVHALRSVDGTVVRAPDGLRAIAAIAVGAVDSGRFYADLINTESGWRVERALLVMSNGMRLPLAGDAPPALAPQ